MISGSDNLLGLRTRVRQYIHENNSQTSWWGDPFINQVLNNAYRKRCTQLISASEGYFSTTLVTPVIANEPFYAWPDGFERLLRLDLQDVLQKVSYPLERWERRSVGLSKGIPVLGNYLPTYRPVGGGFLLEPELTVGLGQSSIVWESFDSPITAYTAPAGTNADTNLIAQINNMKEGAGCIALRKTATTQAAPQFYVERTGLALDLSGQSEVYYWAYFPGTDVALVSAPTRATYLILTSAAGSSEFRTTTTTLSTINPPRGEGWNRIVVDLTNPDAIVGTGVDFAAISEIKIGFGVATQATLTYGFLVDALHSAVSDTASSYNLLLEYVGLPPYLTDDSNTLHPEFPASMEDLLVLDAACSLMASESALENGTVRALARERAEWDVTFARYVDSRIVSKERVDPFVGHYSDA